MYVEAKNISQKRIEEWVELRVKEYDDSYDVTNPASYSRLARLRKHVFEVIRSFDYPYRSKLINLWAVGVFPIAQREVAYKTGL